MSGMTGRMPAFCALLLGLVTACRGDAPPAPTLGQWVWSDTDARLLRDARRSRPALQAAIWAGSITESGGRLTSALGISPARLGAGVGGMVKVIRFETSVARLFDSAGDSAVAARLGERLAALLSISRPAAGTVQLDFDAPERLLPRWASVVRLLRDGPLRGHEVWVTSIPAHVQHARYGRWFRHAVDGHILQVFDTGESYNESRVRRLIDLADGHQIPFQLGVGSFERSLGGRHTTHRAWFDEVPRFAASRWYRGLWVFPAGTEWTVYLPRAS
jgi:hypothetical protein